MRRIGGGEPGPGRPRGSVNRTTKDVRTAIAQIAQRNIGRFEQWLQAVAEDEAARAAELYLRALEFHIPKLRYEFGHGQPTFNVIVDRDGSRRRAAMLAQSIDGKTVPTP